ncbi:hypothetical protein [Streptomyces sp. 2A115]|uniref:hypothetical protein n=1 Tax=Streptomyces sp. 2A115 TaxID=3457439 RepID=UPI003FCF870C
MVTAVTCVVPEVQRHGRHRSGDHQLGGLPTDRPARRTPRLQRDTQGRTGQLTGPDRQDRCAADERGRHARPTAHGLHLDVFRDRGADPLVRGCRQV